MIFFGNAAAKPLPVYHGGFSLAKAFFLPPVELGVYFLALRLQLKKPFQSERLLIQRIKI